MDDDILKKLRKHIHNICPDSNRSSSLQFWCKVDNKYVFYYKLEFDNKWLSFWLDEAEGEYWSNGISDFEFSNVTASTSLKEIKRIHQAIWR